VIGVLPGPYKNVYATIKSDLRKGRRAHRRHPLEACRTQRQGDCASRVRQDLRHAGYRA